MVLKKNIKDFLSVSSANLISGLILGLFWLFLASLLPKSEYGQIGLLMGIVSVIFTASLLGLRATIMVYEPKGENIFPTAFVLILITSLVGGMIGYVLTENFMVGILVPGMSIFSLVNAGLLSKKKYKEYSIRFILRAALAASIAIVSYQWLGINGILLGYFIGAVIVVVDLVRMVKNKPLEFSKIKSKFRFTLYAYGNRLTLVLFRWGDKIIVGSLFDLLILGSYFFATQYFLLIDNIPRAISQYLIPRESLGQSSKKIKIFSIAISCLIAVVSIVAVPFGINLLLPEYQDSILPIQILSLAIIPRSISSIQKAEFLGTENSRIVFFGGVIQSGLYLVLIVILGQFLGLMGMAIGLLSAVIIRTIYNLIVKSRMNQDELNNA